MEKSVTGMVVWHHEACQVMTNCDPEGQIFLFHPYMNNGSFFLLTIAFSFQNKLPEVPEYIEMQYHMLTSLWLNIDVT